MRNLITSLILPFSAVFAGSCLAAQGALNANLKAGLHSWSWAALISYLGGSLVIAAAILSQGATLPTLSACKAIPWFAWIGGFFGAIYIVLSILLLPRLGATKLVSFVIAGQILASLVFDQFGWMGLPKQSVSPFRLVGVLLLIVGVLIIRRR